jgi:branched-chain amino acid transport system substrate-binding protein
MNREVFRAGRRSQGWKLTWGVGAVTLAFAITACSSSSKNASSTNGSSTTGPTPSAAATGAPITVGVICSCSGAFGSSNLSNVDVYKAWVNTVNASGGIVGHPIHLTVDDDGGVPGTSASDVQNMVSAHVDAILDESLFDETWASTVKTANIPVIGGILSSEPFFTNSDFYPEGQTIDSGTYAQLLQGKTAGAANLGDLYCAESVICKEAISQAKSDGQQLGLPLIFTPSISATAPNYTAQCVAAQQAHVQSILLGLGPQVAVKVGADCARQGYHPIYLGGGTGFSNLYVQTAGVNENFWPEVPDLPFTDTTPSVQEMNAAVDKYYPGLRANANLWAESSAIAWPSGLLLEDAVKAGGLSQSDTPSNTEIVQGLQALKGDTLQGWAPVGLTFAAGQPHPVDCWYTLVVKNGTVTQTNNGKPTCKTGSS